MTDESGDSPILDQLALPVLQVDELQENGARVAMIKAALDLSPGSGPTAMLIRRAVTCANSGRIDEAARHYQEAVDSGHPEHSPNAAGLLGLLLQKHGDLDGAELAYRRAAATGHPEYAPFAALCLGFLLLERGDLLRSMAAFQQCKESGDAENATPAALGLGYVQLCCGDHGGVRDSCGFIMKHGNPEERAAAQALLEKSRERQ